jgi:RNA polymerase sigma-70 factor (ECF subfamily)
VTDLESSRHDDFLRLHATHEPAVRGYVRSLLPTRDDASEVMQEAAIVLWRKFEQLDDPKNFRKWAFGVARVEVMTWRRDKARDRHVFSDELAEVLADEAAFDSRDERSEAQRRALEFCLKKLPVEKQTLLQRAYDGDTRIDRLAAELNRSAMSLYKILHRLRLKMVKCTRKFIDREQEEQYS